MGRLGAGNRVFVILSRKYLRSPYCMFELHELWRTSRQESEAFLERVRVFAVPDAQFETPLQRALLAKHWKEKYDELEPHVLLLGERDIRLLKQMGEFYRHVGDILAVVADIVRPRTFEELAHYGFDDPPMQQPA